MFDDPTQTQDFGGTFSGFEVNGTASLGLDVSPFDAPLPEADASIDDVWDQILDDSKDEEYVKSVLPPGGYYLLSDVSFNETRKEAKVGVKNEAGLLIVEVQNRARANFVGTGYQEKDGRTYKARIRFSLSPQAGYKVDMNGTPDPDKLARDYKFFTDCKVLYKRTNGRNPRTFRELTHWLDQTPLKVRTFQANDGLIVLDIMLQG